ncbi:MAG: phosphotransferase [Chloroflexota bacterium]
MEKFEFVREIVEEWGGEPDSLELVRDSINAVFRYREGAAYRFLRISKYWAPKKIVGAMDYLRFLWANGAPVCEPIASKNGRFIEYYTHHAPQERLHYRDRLQEADVARYICRVYAESPGETVTNRCTDPLIHEAWGRALAHLHNVAIHYQPRPDLYFHSWEKEFNDTKRWLPAGDTAAWREFERLQAWYQSLEEVGAGFGVTHADCNAGNFVWNGRSITIIDFDEPMTNWFASDVARPFIEIEDFPLTLRRQLMVAFVNGYRQVRSLSDATVASLPQFMRFKKLAFYAWEIGDCGTPHDDEDLIRLRNQFKNPVEW